MLPRASDSWKIPAVAITDSVYMLGQQSLIRPSRLRRAIVEIAVPCAMALSATAFSAGLYMQGGFGPVPSLIAGGALFLIVICAQAAYAGSRRAAHAMERLGELETAVHGVQESNGTGQSITQLSEKIEQFDTMAEHINQLNLDITRIQRERSDIDPSRIRRLSAEVERIDARQDALKAQFQIESRERYEDLSAELKMLETLVKQLTENVANASASRLKAGPEVYYRRPKKAIWRSQRRMMRHRLPKSRRGKKQPKRFHNCTSRQARTSWSRNPRRLSRRLKSCP